MADARSMATTLLVLFIVAVPLVLLYRGAIKSVTESLHRYQLIRLFTWVAITVTILVISNNPPALLGLIRDLTNGPDG